MLIVEEVLEVQGSCMSRACFKKVSPVKVQVAGHLVESDGGLCCSC